ncbi:hypothetical protein ACWDTQ_22880 [Streptomyces cellulosae]|uniref:Uncharacterized protein n=1 Tax=Streptomyces cellulosae TaxID=1968 RepID=A0ABW6JJT4_STRCE
MSSHDVRSGHAHDEPGTTVSRQHGVTTRVTCEDGFFVIVQTTDVTTPTGPEDTSR